MFFGGWNGWNVRSCAKQSKRELIIKQLKKYRIQIAALSETCMYGFGIQTVGGHTMIYSGLSSDNKTRNAHGVAICLGETAAKIWKQSGSEWEAVSERIVKIRMNCFPINVTVIAVYSPVNPTTNQMHEACEKFYKNLQDTINNIRRDDMIIIMGDFNARVGEEKQPLPQQQSQNLPNCFGRFTVDKLNENGTYLMDFCLYNDLIIANTFFDHKPIHQTPWMHPASRKWHTLDYTLVNRKYRSSVEDVRMLRRAAGTIGTDHHLMRVKVKFHLKSRRRTNNKEKAKYDPAKMKEADTVRRFQSDIRSTLDAYANNSISAAEKYSQFVVCLKDNAEKHFKTDSNTSKKRKEWLTDEILKIVDKKSLVFVEWQNARGTPTELARKNKYRRLRKLVKTKIDERQIEYWDEVCEQIEKAVKLNDPATAFGIIRRLRGGSKRVENMPIKNKNGVLLVNSADRL